MLTWLFSSEIKKNSLLFCFSKFWFINRCKCNHKHSDVTVDQRLGSCILHSHPGIFRPLDPQMKICVGPCHVEDFRYIQDPFKK